MAIVKKSLLVLVISLGVYLRAELAPSAEQAVSKERASFPHSSKKHRELACTDCHTVSKAKPDVHEFPGHAKCISCHNFAEMVFTKPAFCSICHSGRPISKAQPALFEFPKPQVPTDFGIGFSHVSHRRNLPEDIRIEQVRQGFIIGQGPRCTDCHKLQTARFPEMSIEKGHSTCFVCHGEIPASGRRKPAKQFPYMNDCAECHQLDGPRSPQLYGIVPRFKHSDHDYEIRPIRKQDYVEVKAPDRLCSQCHSSVERATSLREIRLPEPTYCDQCHNGKLGLPDPLGKDVIESLQRR
jgi:predicted CXXCH cytochrome family protein